MAKRKIASQNEVLEFLTTIMRREAEDTKLSDAMSAADKLYRIFKETKEHETDAKQTGVGRLPEVREENR